MAPAQCGSVVSRAAVAAAVPGGGGCGEDLRAWCDLAMQGDGADAGFDAQEVALRALVSGIAGREEAALAAFYDATASRVYTLALRIIGNREAAEEVTQDVYLQVWQRARDYDPLRGKVTTWVYTVCRSRAIDQLRRHQPEGTRNTAEFAELTDEHRVMPDPGDALAELEQGNTLHAALGTLEAAERQLLALAYFRGMSHQEIAGRTGMPLGTVKTILRKAINVLRERLGAAEAESPIRAGAAGVGLMVS